MVDDERLPLRPGEEPQMKLVRFRTLGCYPLTGAVESTATTLPEIIEEMLLATTSERQGRVIDHDEAGSMEQKKKEGYFLMADAGRPDRHRHHQPTCAQHERKELLRFLTCGSVDDGKSTLIGRLLLRLEDDLRGPARRRAAATASARARPAARSTWRC